ncbi:MAG: glycosyltransferase [Betaproteobacteria bacterium]|nr:glycosyltransferase [Betaproteobacteria bacterium]
MMNTLRSLARRLYGFLRRFRLLRALVHPLLKRRLAALPAEAGAGGSGYQKFRQESLLRRRAAYSCRLEPGLLSFVTTVWNTDAGYLEALARSVFGQEGGTDFEWVILDNGSTAPATLARLGKIARHPCVRLSRVERNLGIIGGMRHCLERATGRYVLPLDSDDYLYPDCARILIWHIAAGGRPPLLYTDEDKLAGGAFTEAYLKPDWDPVLFVNSCYIAHLCAIDRELALQLGAYTDAAAEGCHDWDTFMRFFLAGKAPAHVPEVLYGWRMHQQSTSANIGSKSYIHDSHHALLAKFIAAQPRPDRYWLELSPLFQGTPDRWFRRKSAEPRPLTTVILTESPQGGARARFTLDGYPGHHSLVLPLAASIGELRAVAQAVAQEGGLIHLLWEEVRPEGAAWPWEALALMELFPDTVMVGGRIAGPDQRILAAGSYLGFGRGCDCPDRGRAAADPGYFAQMWKQHSVSAVSSQHAVVDAAFLLDLLNQQQPLSYPYLGAWAGAHARRRNLRVVYTPFVQGECARDWDALVPETERLAFLRANLDLMPDTRFLSAHLGLTPETAYAPVAEDERRRHLLSLARAGATSRAEAA